jgi:hypothetical protein
MFSFPLFERLKAATPEFEEVAAFQAGGNSLSVRRQGNEKASKPLRSEYVTGNYFSTLGIIAFGGRLFAPADDKPSATPVALISHHSWQIDYGADPSVVGSTFIIEGHPFTIIGVTPAGFFGETLRGDPPDIWIPLQQEPLIDADRSLLHQSVGAWLRIIGRLRPRASIEGMGARLTVILRQWMQHDSGYPPNWMADIVRLLPKQTINVSCGCRSWRNERRVWPQSADPPRSLRHGLADCLCERGEPAFGAGHCTSNANCFTARRRG